MIEITIATLLAALVSDSQERARPLIKQAYRVLPGTVFHVRVMDPDAPIAKHLTFTPRVPPHLLKSSYIYHVENYPKKPGAPAPENRTCPRVCFSYSLAGAMAAINLGMATLDQTGCATPKRVDIYVNRSAVNMGMPTETAVHDAEGTGELWALEPIELELIRIVDPDKTEQIAIAEDYAEEFYSEEIYNRGPSEVNEPILKGEEVRRLAVIAVLEKLKIP